MEKQVVTNLALAITLVYWDKLWYKWRNVTVIKNSIDPSHDNMHDTLRLMQCMHGIT